MSLVLIQAREDLCRKIKTVAATYWTTLSTSFQWSAKITETHFYCFLIIIFSPQNRLRRSRCCLQKRSNLYNRLNISETAGQYSARNPRNDESQISVKRWAELINKDLSDTKTWLFLWIIFTLQWIHTPIIRALSSLEKPVLTKSNLLWRKDESFTNMALLWQLSLWWAPLCHFSNLLRIWERRKVKFTDFIQPLRQLGVKLAQWQVWQNQNCFLGRIQTNQM